MEPIIITSAFYLAVAFLCWTRPNAGRIFVGLFFWVMAIGVHGYFIFANPQAYVDFANEAHFGIYRDLATPVVEFSPVGFGILVGLFELVVGGLILSRGRLVRIGLTGAIIFLVAISPLMAVTLPNLVLAATLAYLLGKEFDSSAWQTLHGLLPEERRRRTLA